jgi:hypothetical protein
MLRAVILAVLVLMPVQAVAAQTAAEAYEACLVGHSVTGVLRSGLPVAKAFARAGDLCSGLRDQVSEGYCTGESCGIGSVEEDVIHFLENIVKPLLQPDP